MCMQDTKNSQEAQHSPFSDVAGEAVEGRRGASTSDESSGNPDSRKGVVTDESSDSQAQLRGRAQTAGPRMNEEVKPHYQGRTISPRMLHLSLKPASRLHNCQCSNC